MRVQQHERQDSAENSARAEGKEKTNEKKRWFFL